MPAEPMIRTEIVHACIDFYCDADDQFECKDALGEDEDCDRYMLLEQGTGPYKHRFWVTTHATPESALEYHFGQEYGEDWMVFALVDLNTMESLEWRVHYEVTGRNPWVVPGGTSTATT